MSKISLKVGDKVKVNVTLFREKKAVQRLLEAVEPLEGKVFEIEEHLPMSPRAPWMLKGMYMGFHEKELIKV